MNAIAGPSAASTEDPYPEAIPASHEASVAEIVELLWDAQGAAMRAVEAGELEALHECEAQIDEALHALEAPAESLAESRRGRAQQLFADLFGVVDGLHEAADSEDLRELARLVRRLPGLIEQIPPLFLTSDADGVRTSARLYRYSTRI